VLFFDFPPPTPNSVPYTNERLAKFVTGIPIEPLTRTEQVKVQVREVQMLAPQERDEAANFFSNSKFSTFLWSRGLVSSFVGIGDKNLLVLGAYQLEENGDSSSAQSLLGLLVVRQAPPELVQKLPDCLFFAHRGQNS